MTDDQRELAAALLGWSDAIERGERISAAESEARGYRRELPIREETNAADTEHLAA